MGISVSEQETVIQMSRGSDFARIWTSDTTIINKLDKLVDESEANGAKDWILRDVGYINGEIVNKEYFARKNLISFRKKTKEMSEEQKLEVAKRLKDGRDKK